MESKKLRTITAAAVLAIVTVGFLTNWGIGTLSAPGFWDVSILCPLGALGTMLSSKTMIPRAVISLIVMVALILLFARAFCGWICPVPLVQKTRNIFSKKQPEDLTKSAKNDSEKSGQIAEPLSVEEQTMLKATCSKENGGGCTTCAAKRGTAPDARHFVLGGALLSTFAFGFPVFCLVCPIGLTLATILLVINLFSHGDVSWSLIFVPLLLAVEVLFFRKWCKALCPLSAFMSLIAKANKTFVPTIDDKKCLETSRGASCGICGRVCGEGIDPRHPQLSEADWSECIKCRDCVDACPVNAINMPLMAKRKTDDLEAPSSTGELASDPATLASTEENAK